jgi:non-ribosomal peptide synthase protein (TIGR01720 family)
VYNTRINDVLLASLLWAAHRRNGAQLLSLFLEGHGRVPFWNDVDVSRTVGWFTTVYPVDLDMNGVHSCDAVLKRVKEQLRSIPRDGVGYGILRYLGAGSLATELERQPQPGLLFNYLGQMDRGVATGNLAGRQVYGVGRTRSVRNRRAMDLEITALVAGGRLEVRWGFGRNVYSRADVEAMAEAYVEALRELIAHCVAAEARGYSPSDFPDVALSQDDLDGLLRQLNNDN